MDYAGDFTGVARTPRDATEILQRIKAMTSPEGEGRPVLGLLLGTFTGIPPGRREERTADYVVSDADMRRLLRDLSFVKDTAGAKHLTYTDSPRGIGMPGMGGRFEVHTTASFRERKPPSDLARVTDRYSAVEVTCQNFDQVVDSIREGKPFADLVNDLEGAQAAAACRALEERRRQQAKGVIAGLYALLGHVQIPPTP